MNETVASCVGVVVVARKDTVKVNGETCEIGRTLVEWAGDALSAVHHVGDAPQLRVPLVCELLERIATTSAPNVAARVAVLGAVAQAGPAGKSRRRRL